MKYKKLKLGITLIGLMCVIAGCNQKDNVKESESSNQDKVEETESITEEQEVIECTNENGVTVYEWHIDVTQDGIPEKIVTNPDTLGRQIKEDENTIAVYSGKTGELIWSDDIGAAHMTWNGVYIYHDNEKDYLMEWNPYSGTGGCVFRYRIFSLSESGEEIEIMNESFGYRDIEVTEQDIEDLKLFADEVNGYLAKSFVLVAVTKGMTGDHYSTAEEKVVSLYDPTSELELMQRYLQDSLNSNS